MCGPLHIMREGASEHECGCDALRGGERGERRGIPFESRWSLLYHPISLIPLCRLTCAACTASSKTGSDQAALCATLLAKEASSCSWLGWSSEIPWAARCGLGIVCEKECSCVLRTLHKKMTKKNLYEDNSEQNAQIARE